MDALTRDAILREDCEYRKALYDFLADTESMILKNFLNSKPEHLGYLQGQYAVINYIRDYINSIDASIDYIKEE